MSGNSNMQKTLTGMVRDHRLPCDYNHHWNQPFHTTAFLKNFKTFMINRLFTKQNIWKPMVWIFVFTPALCFYQIMYSYLVTGHWP